MSSLPRSILSPALLTSIRERPALPANTWYLITATTLSALNRSHELPDVYTHAISSVSKGLQRNQSHDEQLHVTRRTREALVKAIAVNGLPKAINSLLALKAATPPHLLDEPGESSATGRVQEVFEGQSSDMLHRGQAFFDAVYGKVSKRVMGQMDRSGTQDLGLTARLMYGYLLSNTTVLTQVETSFVLIAGLIPQDVNPQLKGHLKGALNAGATVEEVKAVRGVVIDICEASGMKRLDEGDTGGWGWRGDVADL